MTRNYKFIVKKDSVFDDDEINEYVDQFMYVICRVIATACDLIFPFFPLHIFNKTPVCIS